MKLIQWFECESLDSISPLCVLIGRILSFNHIQFTALSFSIPTTIEQIDVRLQDVPILITKDGNYKGVIKIINYLQVKGLIKSLYPLERRSIARNQIIHEWSIDTFFPISTYFSYKLPNNYENFKKYIKESQTLPEDELDLAVTNLRKMLLNNFRYFTVFKMNEHEAKKYLHEHLSLVSLLLEENQFLTGTTLRLADITAFSALSRLFYTFQKDINTYQESYRKIFVWLHKVDELTQGPNSKKALHLY